MGHLKACEQRREILNSNEQGWSDAAALLRNQAKRCCFCSFMFASHAKSIDVFSYLSYYLGRHELQIDV